MLHMDRYERTLQSQMVQESCFQRSPSLRSRPSLSVQSVLLRRVSSLLICKDRSIYSEEQWSVLTSTLSRDSRRVNTFLSNWRHILIYNTILIINTTSKRLLKTAFYYRPIYSYKQ